MFFSSFLAPYERRKHKTWYI